MPGVTAPLLRIMENVYSVIGMGPASLTQPVAGQLARGLCAGIAVDRRTQHHQRGLSARAGWPN